MSLDNIINNSDARNADLDDPDARWRAKLAASSAAGRATSQGKSVLPQTNAFLKMWNAGYKYLVPIVPPGSPISDRSILSKRPKAIGKVPGIKGHDGFWTSLKQWQALQPTEDDLALWFAMGAGVGLRFGLQADGTYLFGIDADTKVKNCAGIIRAQVEGMLGNLPTRIGEAPKALYLIRTNGPLPYLSIGFEGGVVEVLGQGKQAVAANAIHPVTLQPYAWTRGLVALDELQVFDPSVIVDLLESLKARLPEAGDVYREGDGGRPSNQQQFVGVVAELERAIPLIPNVYTCPGRNSFVKMAAAFRGAFQDDYERGLELFCEWADKADLSSRPDDSVHEDPTQMYRSVKAPFNVGAGYLYELAEATDASGDFKRDDAFAAKYFDATAAARQPDTLPAAKAKAPKLEMVLFDDIADTALTVSSKPLVEDLLDQGAMSVLFGESNTGKTFVATDLAYHVASGRDWGGKSTSKGVVVYIAAEGGAGARKRAAALKKKYGPCAGFRFILSPVDLRNPNADLKPLLELLGAIDGIVLIVIDTLSRALAGGDENSSIDMGSLVQHFDLIRTVTGAHLLVVHHTGKLVARGARGHSLLRAATDTEIEITEGQIRVTKQRDLEKCSAVGFALETVVLGKSERGKDITSCTVRLIARGGAETGEPSAKEADVLLALRACVATSDRPTSGAGLAEIATAAGEYDRGGKERVRTHLRNLMTKNLVTSPGRGVWVPRDIHAHAYFEEIDSPQEAPRNLGRQRPLDATQKAYSETPLSDSSGGLFS